jgi:hypothetical protein
MRPPPPIGLIFFAAWCGALACAQLFWPEAFRPPFYTSLPILFLFLATTARSNSKRLDALEKAVGVQAGERRSGPRA